jgi:hypothetical protein
MVHSLRPFFIMLLISLFLSFAIEPASTGSSGGNAPRASALAWSFSRSSRLGRASATPWADVLSDQVTQFVDDAPGYIDDAQEWFNDHGIDVNFDDLRDSSSRAVTRRSSRRTSPRERSTSARPSPTPSSRFHDRALHLLFGGRKGPNCGAMSARCFRRSSARGAAGLGSAHREDRRATSRLGACSASSPAVRTSLAFVAIGLPSPLPLGLWVGFMSQFIPVVGTYLAGALPLAHRLIDNPSPGCGR